MQSSLQDVPNVPQYCSFFTRVKVSMPRMLVDEKLTTEYLRKLSLSIEIRKIFFCLVLEKCNSVEMQPKRNTLLKIMNSQKKLVTACNYAFNNSAGFTFSQFENERVQGE